MNIRKPRGYWNKEKCIYEALKYTNKTDFNVNSKSAYLSAYRNGWLNEITQHMVITGSLYDRCIYSYEFTDNCVYIGLTFNLSKRHANRINSETDIVTIVNNFSAN